MKRSSRRTEKGKGALELLEEATALLRRAPLPAFAAYCTGTFPFVLGLLYFWTDMSLSGQAPDRLVDESLLVALLYLWMKWWQAIFAGHLRRLLADQPPSDGIEPGELFRQGALHPWSFLILPVALLLTIPFGWCFAFFQNVTVLGAEGGELPTRLRRAARLAGLWPGQNHLLISLLFLCWLFAYLNLGVAAYLVPRLLKSLLGMDTILSRSNLHLMNSTFFVTLGALAWLCLDPLVKAVYLLRCYYGASLTSGADLLQGFRRASGGGRVPRLLVVTACLLALARTVDVSAAGSPPLGEGRPGSATLLDSARLEGAIRKTLAAPEFSWRLPRTAREDKIGTEQGLFGGPLKRVGEWLKAGMEWVVRLAEKLSDLLPKPAPEKPATGGTPFGGRVFLAMYLLLGVIVAWGGVVLKRSFLSRGGLGDGEGAACTTASPDLADEGVTADRFPPERWQELADRLFAGGEVRLAFRALYLAAIAHLAAEQFLTLARGKSNREYERELRRRAHTLPLVADSFAENVAIFERVWYGLYQPENGALERFTDNYRRILSHARRG